MAGTFDLEAAVASRSKTPPETSSIALSLDLLIVSQSSLKRLLATLRIAESVGFVTDNWNQTSADDITGATRWEGSQMGGVAKKWAATCVQVAARYAVR